MTGIVCELCKWNGRTWVRLPTRVILVIFEFLGLVWKQASATAAKHLIDEDLPPSYLVLS